jgi:hypothetical protein
MSAALQWPVDWQTSIAQAAWQIAQRKGVARPATQAEIKPETGQFRPSPSLAFYRRHTESLLRRYLYASMQVGRAPSILSDPVARGWASSRPVRTFEDAVIFVLDIESCLSQLGSLDRELLGRIVLQEYTQTETAILLGMSPRTVSNRFALALDRLTERFLKANLLVLPH